MALSIAVTARKLFSLAEKITTGKLNLANYITIALSGSASTSQIEDRAVTSAKVENFGAFFEGTDSGTANAHAVAITSGLAAPVQGTMLCYQVNATNTSGTVNVTVTASPGGAWAARPIRETLGVDLQPGRLLAGQYVLLRWDVTNSYLQLLSVSPEPPSRYLTATGSANAFVLTGGTTTGFPSIYSYSNMGGRPVYAKANFDVTGATTVNIDGLGAKALRKQGNTALESGDIVTSQIFGFIYDATLDVFLLITPVVPASARVVTSVRQTVLSGPVDSNGHPVLLTYSGQAVTLKATTSDPLVVVLAAGFDVSGAVDYVHRLTADAASAWTIPTSNATYYLFVDRDSSTGAITYGYTTSQPSYVNDDAASISSGAHTFLINRMKMYLGDGAAAAEKQRVFLGEALVSGSVITSVTSYMFKGEFQSPTDTAISALASNQAFTDSHKLGLMPASMECVLVAQGSTLNYVAGDEVDVQGITNSSYAYRYDHTWKSLTQLGWNYIAATYGAPYIVNKTSMGAPSAISAAGDFKVRFRASRGW